MNAPTACELNPAPASSRLRSLLPVFASACLAPAIILWVLSPALFGNDRIAFRDVSHFYTPLYHYVAERTSQQWFPLWNDRCQTGMPLLGETTPAALYPVRYVLGSLPMSAERQIAWFIAAHLILASVLARFCAADARAGAIGQTVAGLAYPLSGSIFFLYSNPPFLASAAWLPLALSTLITPGQTRPLRRIGLAGTALAMMTLGGDPQTALHTLMISSMVISFKAFMPANSRTDSLRQFGALVAAAMLATVLAAPQIASGWSWAGQSDRMLSGVSISEADQYRIAPWHFAELITTNLFGSWMPVYQRISVLIPGDGRMWTPTLFMGTVPVLMLIDRVTRWRRTRGDVWIGVAVAAALLSMGQLGMIWTVLHHFLPGYDSFRYPAKWLPFFALGLSIASAVWIESKSLQVSRKSLVILAVLAVAGWLSVTLLSRSYEPTPSTMIADEFWGPLDVGGAVRQITLSILFSLACLTAIGIVVFKSSPRATRWMLITILGIELTVSTSWQLATVSVNQEQALIQTLQQRDRDIKPARRNLRMQRAALWPPEWKQTSNRDRLKIVEAHQRLCWFGRWHLIDNAAVMNNMVTVDSYHHAQFWKAVKQRSKQSEDIDWAAIRRWLGIDQTLVQSGGLLTAIPSNVPADPLEAVSVWRSIPANAVTQADRRTRFDQIASGETGEVTLLTNEPSDPAVEPESRPTPSHSNVIGPVILESPQNVIVNVRTEDPILLIRPVFQDGHWSAMRRESPEANLPASDPRSEWESCEVGQVDFLKQGTVVPPGNWQIQFVYQPWWWIPSITVAIAGWAILIGSWAAGWIAGRLTYKPKSPNSGVLR